MSQLLSMKRKKGRITYCIRWKYEANAKKM